MLQAFSIPALAAYAAIIFGIYKFIIYETFLSPLSKIPAANWTTHWSPWWLYWLRYTRTENQTVYELHKKLGPIVRMAPNELSVNCYEGGLKTIYTGGFPKHDFYARRFTNYGVIPMFAMKNKEEHSTRKRMMSNVYSKSYVMSSPTVAATTKATVFDRYLPIMQRSSDTGKPVEMLSLNYGYSMDSFMTMQFDLKLGPNLIQNDEERKWYLEHFFSRRPWMFWTDDMPTIESWLRKIGIRLVPAWCDKSTEALEKWQIKFCDDAEKLLEEDPNPPAADYPVVYAQERAQLRKSGRPDPYADSQPYPYRLDVATDMYDHNAAAHETSGDTLTWLYYELSRRPQLMADLRKELMTLDPPLLFPPPAGQEIKLPDPKAVDQLPLLDAILQETLRIWTAVPGGQPRVTPPGVHTLAGYDNIPAGVRVQAASYTLHRNPDAFPDPLEWKPERWLNPDPKQLSEMRHYFWAWGSGGAMCIGSNIAVHSMKHAIAGLYTNFTSTIVDSADIDQAEGFTAGPKGNKLVLQWKHV